MTEDNKTAISLIEIARKAEPIDATESATNFLRLILENETKFEKQFQEECSEKFIKRLEEEGKYKDIQKREINLSLFLCEK